MSGYTAHLDSFARDHLPPRALWPDLRFDLPELRYPARLNCAAELLDRAIERGLGDKVAFYSPNQRWTYRELLERANRIANVLQRRSRAGAGQPGAAARGQQSDAGRLLARRAEGRRHRGHHHAAAARARARDHHRQGADHAGAVRRAPGRGARAGARAGAGVRAHLHVRRLGPAGRRRRARAAHGRRFGELRERRDRRRRCRPDRVHLGHHRQAQGHDALSPRRAGDLRLLPALDPEAHGRRHLHRQPADRLHLRARRLGHLPDARWRIRRAARGGAAGSS